jgi:hypothetical protein
VLRGLDADDVPTGCPTEPRSGGVGIFNTRVDADHRDPLAAPEGLCPFRVVHRWKEGTALKEHAERITRLPHRYTIDSGDDPEMVSVTYEMP